MPRRLLLLSLAVLCVAISALARDVPYLSGRVVDEAGMIPADVRQRIEQKLAAYEQQTGNQVAVLTVESLEGDPIEDFSMRVAETWKLGQAEKDNGVLLVIAEQDRRMRIEVGYGLEPVLTDLESGRIVDNVIRPAFQAGDFGGGIERGADAILAALGGEEVPEAAPAGGGEAPGCFTLIFLFVIGTFSLSAITSPGPQGWILYFFLMPFFYFIPSVIFPGLGIAALIAWIVLFPILKLLFGRRLGDRRRGRMWGGGGWFPGGFGGGGFGGRGGGGFGGGFSGGGGSFGGGGASGSW
jgi:uncharacterized protein